MVRFATEVAPILRAKCQQACHGGQYQSAGTAYTRLRAMTANNTACASQPRIVVNDGANSLVIKKLLGTQTCGGRMPQVAMGAGSRACNGTECVAASDIDLIKRWIDQGAQNN